MSGADLVLIDGSSYLYRAFHALPNLSNSAGEPTGALHGVLTMINKLVREQPAAQVGVVFDAPGKTFRDELFADYKATRPPMPDELRDQVAPLLEAVRSMGLPLLQVEGVEADDVIGTLCREAGAKGLNVLVSTGDKDLAQLVNDNVTLVNTMNDSVLDRDGVKTKFDVYPEQIIDFLALVGDSSDNIPGVPKVGAKTAAKWLNQYGSADGIIDNADDIKGKVGESLRDNIEQFRLSRELATIRLDIDLPVTVSDLAPTEADIDNLRKLYGRFELRTLLRQLDEQADAPEPEPESVTGDYETVLTWKAFDKWQKKINNADLVAFDTETTSLDYMAAEIVGVSFCIEPGKAAYVPLAHDYAGAPDQLSREAVLGKLKGLLEDPAAAKLGHHLKYDAHVLANHGIALAGMRYDSMLESYVLNSTATRHDMDSCARRYLGVETIHYEDVAGKGAKQISFSQVAIDTAAEYSAEDADITLQLHRVLWEGLTKEPSLRKLYEEIEQPLVPVLFRMEHHGVLVDRDTLRRQGGEIARRLGELEQEAHEAAGQPFNLDSPKQLQEILFNKLNLPTVRKTPKGQPSTAEDVLEELAASYPLPRIILEYRGLAKLKSTYTDKLPGQVDARTGRVHTSYHQAVAVTGRLSSSDPNLQNIPIRTPEGRRIRQAFIAPPGHLLLAADYSQIELRIMAHLSGDRSLLDAFASDRDIHQATAAEVLGVATDEVTAEQRRAAKAINFGLIYGMSAFGLARQLGSDRATAQEYVDRYFERYPGVKRYMDETRESARERGYVETVFGRRLYLPDIRSRNRQQQQYAERSAINAPMQGTAADIIKRAMITVDEWIQRERPGARLVMQVHDELVLEVEAGVVDEVRARLVGFMTAAAELQVPLKVDTGVGANWDDAH